MIELHNVCKAYKIGSRIHKVLDSVNFCVPADRNLGILGVNGAGKSTLIRLISGVEEPNSGYIIRNCRVSWPIGFVGCFHPKLTGVENTIFAARIYGVNINKVANFVREFSELGDFINMEIRTYSSGMKARLAFALSMAIDFDCYLVDEVTAVGDKKFQKKCHEAFEERSKNSNIIMVSHSISTIKSYCDRAAVLDSGQLHIYESVDDAIVHYEKINQ